ncbi:MAG: PilZ domain-containing protein [Desulfurivibrionaceae bacterium]
MKTVRATGIAHSSTVVRIRCACSVVFPIRFEYRKTFRKAINLVGIYHVLFDNEDIPELSQGKKTINCRVENISMYGAGFSVLGRHHIKENSRLLLGFTLDNLQKTWIEKTGVARRVTGAYIGMQFDEAANVDQTLGFYLRP